MSEPKTLLLTETGIARTNGDVESVNVGPIVAALRFLTEGRGDDRGIDDQGAPLPDLMSLAFDVVRSIIVGGVDAEFFHEVKRQFDARAEGRGASLGLAKRATLARAAPLTVVKRASAELRARLKRLDEAAAQLDLELEALDGARSPSRRRAAKNAPRKPAKKVAKVRRRAGKKKSAKRARTTRSAG